MAILRRTGNYRRIVCAGDLNIQVKVQLRQLTAPTADGVDASITLSDVKTVWAMMRTVQGSEFFDGTNLSHAYTHEFFIRFIPNTVFTRSGRLSAQERVEYNSRQYQISDVENYEERNEFLVIKCIERGATAKVVNGANV